MNKKLTLSIEENTIERAKKYARENGRSLSDLIENYLDSITSRGNIFHIKNESSITQSLKGRFKVSEEFNEKEVLKAALEEKYLK
jgi:hypothetical protein